MVRAYLFFLPLLLIIGLGNCGILGGEDKEKPIVWEEESLEDFVVYAHSYISDYLYIIDPVNGVYETVDKFQKIYSITTNENGSLLYVSVGEGQTYVQSGSIYEVDPIDWEYKKIYHRPVEFIHSTRKDIYFVTKAVLDTGRFANYLPERILGRIDSNNGTVIELSTIEMAAANFHDFKAIQIHPNLPLAYFISTKAQLVEHNFESQQSRILLDGLTLTHHPNFRLSPDGNFIYFLGGPVYDTNSELIVGNTKVFKWGYLAIRKDNKEVYLTDNGDSGIYNRPKVNNINIYSKESDSIVDSVVVGGITDNIFLTPMERYAVVNERSIVLNIIDLKEREIAYEFDFLNEITKTNIDRIYLSIKPGEN